MNEQDLARRLEAEEPSERVLALREAVTVQTWAQPEEVVVTLTNALGDKDESVRMAAMSALWRVGLDHQPALAALVRAALEDERLPAIVAKVVNPSVRRAAEVIRDEIARALASARNDEGFATALGLLAALGPAGARFLGRADLDSVADALLKALPDVPPDARIAAVDALVDLEVPAAHLIEQVNGFPWPPAEQVEVQRFLVRRQEEDNRHASRTQRRPEGRWWVRPVLTWLLALVGVVAIGVPMALAIPSTSVGVAIAAGVILAGVSVIIALWFRCPSCRRWWAGRLQRVEYLRTADTAQMRDTTGVSRTVTVNRVRSIRHYQCRFCKGEFIR